MFFRRGVIPRTFAIPNSLNCAKSTTLLHNHTGRHRLICAGVNQDK